MAGDGSSHNFRSDSPAQLVCTGLTKSYNGVTVLDGVDLTLRGGSVTGLIGENGAGKSTLSAIITGVVAADSGAMRLEGHDYRPASPQHALRAGVALIHQEIRTLPHLSVAENIYLGRLPMRRGRIDRRRLYDDAAEALGALGVHVDPRRRVEGLSTAVMQEIEIAKAITRNARYVIFDEPTASLGSTETDRVLERIVALRDRGVGIVYISHRLGEVREVCEDIVCLRDGHKVGAWRTSDVSEQDLIDAMVGRSFTFQHHAPEPAHDAVVLDVRDLGRTGAFRGINFSLRRGEILGVAGLVGAGRTEMVRTIAGADRPDEGVILLHGQPLSARSPRAAIDVGIAMVPEDRKGQGLNLDRTGAENIGSPWERSLTTYGVVTGSRLRTLATTAQREFDIRGELGVPVGRLSGGNQQKILLAKWLVRKPAVLILDEPTRGVDVGAKMAIYEIIRRLAAAGVALLIVSSELEEVLGLSHRVLVMSAGRQKAILERSAASPEVVMALAVPTSEAGAGTAA